MNRSTTPSHDDDNTKYSQQAHDSETESAKPPRTPARYQAKQPDDVLITGTDNDIAHRMKAVPCGARRKQTAKAAVVSQEAATSTKASPQDLHKPKIASPLAKNTPIGNMLTKPVILKRAPSALSATGPHPGITDIRGSPQIAGGSFIAPPMPPGIEDVRGIPQIAGGSFIAADQGAGEETRDDGGDETEADSDDEGGVPLSPKAT